MMLLLNLAFVALVILIWLPLLTKKEDNFIIEFILHCFAVIMVFCALATYCSSPEAIDVYRGKTTLEITYKDSIPVDSVVVFKTKTK